LLFFGLSNAVRCKRGLFPSSCPLADNATIFFLFFSGWCPTEPPHLVLCPRDLFYTPVLVRKRFFSFPLLCPFLMYPLFVKRRSGHPAGDFGGFHHGPKCFFWPPQLGRVFPFSCFPKGPGTGPPFSFPTVCFNGNGWAPPPFPGNLSRWFAGPGGAPPNLGPGTWKRFWCDLPPFGVLLCWFGFSEVPNPEGIIYVACRFSFCLSALRCASKGRFALRSPLRDCPQDGRRSPPCETLLPQIFPLR